MNTRRSSFARFASLSVSCAALGFLMSGCAGGPTAEKGVLTTQGRGAQELSAHGDPLLLTGDSARKVSADFAKGYAKSDIDNAHREYFQRLRANTGADQSEADGRPVLYDMTLPERADSSGIVRAPRPVMVTITE